MADTPQTKPQLDGVVDDRLTEVAVLNPSIAILSEGGTPLIALAKDTSFEKNLINLRGVRAVYVPTGAKLTIIRILSRIGIRLRFEEFEYGQIEIENGVPNPVVRAYGKYLCPSPQPTQIISLSGNEYHRLVSARGRDLVKWINSHFQIAGLAKISSDATRKRSAA